MELRKVLRAKIHRAVVTHADKEYEGSVTIPPDLLEAADIDPYEAVQVWNVTNGARFETYAIAGEPGARDLCVNGAAAHHAEPGDIVIIACFGQLDTAAMRHHKPRLVFVDAQNNVADIGEERAGPRPPRFSQHSFLEEDQA